MNNSLSKEFPIFNEMQENDFKNSNCPYSQKQEYKYYKHIMGKSLYLEDNISDFYLDENFSLNSSLNNNSNKSEILTNSLYQSSKLNISKIISSQKKYNIGLKLFPNIINNFFFDKENIKNQIKTTKSMNKKEKNKDSYNKFIINSSLMKIPKSERIKLDYYRKNKNKMKKEVSNFSFEEEKQFNYLNNNLKINSYFPCFSEIKYNIKEENKENIISVFKNNL